MAMRLLLFSAAILASAATAAALHSRDQLPFMADTAATTTAGAATPPSPALHRICLPSSKADSHWPSILSSLSSLVESHPQFDLDFWTDAPRTRNEESCLDFTYPDHPQANALLDDLVHTADVRAEVDWSIVAGKEELREKVVKDKEERKSGTGVQGAGTGTLGVEDHFHNGYHTLANITAWLSWQVFQHPSLTELVELGTSYEDKVIQGIRIGDASKPEVVVLAGAHGREWITTSVSLYLISHLLDLFTTSPSSSPLLSKFSILIIPVLNPDGYLHTWSSPSDRFFRKNRQQVPGRDWWGRQCYGVDVSRNFPVHFAKTPGQPCSPTYAGEEPLVTAESKALAAYLEDKEAHNVVSFLDLHSYGQLLLYPWLSCQSPTSSSPIPDEEDITELTLGAARAAKLTHNKQYRSGRGCETMYGQDGSSVDYAYGQVGVKWSFELELRDEGAYGFLLPPEQIRPAGEEAGAVLGYALEFVARRERL